MENATEKLDIERRFEVETRAEALGGGWRLRLLEQEPGIEEIEVGAGVFPPEPDEGITADDAYADALATGTDWLDSFSRGENENGQKTGTGVLKANKWRTFSYAHSCGRKRSAP